MLREIITWNTYSDIPRRHPLVPLEVPPQIRLVRENQVGRAYLLNGQFGGLEQYFGFEDGKVVNNLFGGVARHAFADTCQVFGGDAQFVGIESHFSLRNAVFVYQCDEILEDFILPASSFNFLTVEVAVALIIDIQHKRLEVIFGNLVTEAVFTVVVYDHCGMYQAVDGSGYFLPVVYSMVFLS